MWRETHESGPRTTHSEFPRSIRTDVSCPAASCGVARSTMSRGTEGAFFLQYVSCLLDIRAELVVTSLTKKYISSCSATGEMVENQLVANDTRGTVEIMTIHRAVLLPSSNSAKFSHRHGWHSCEYRSPSLLSVSRMGYHPCCQQD